MRPTFDAIDAVWRFLFGSFFRFMLILGILLLVIGATWADGIEAGHLAVYGSTAVLIGVIGKLIVWWKIQGKY